MKKCCEEKIIVNFKYANSYYEKCGIIEKIDKKKILYKEIGKSSGVFIAKCEIKFDEIEYIFIKNYSILKSE